VTATDDQISPERLRALIREVLRDALPALAQAPPAPASPGTPSPAVGGPPATGSTRPGTPPTGLPPAPGSRPAPAAPAVTAATRTAPVTRSAGGGEVQAVRMETSDDLREFALHILRLADNPKRRADLLAGRLRFELTARGGEQAAPAQRIDKGAVTERAVIAAAKAGTGLLLGRRAVLTPLAADKARALGVRIEKER
jgi:hypothetical protein